MKSTTRGSLSRRDELQAATATRRRFLTGTGASAGLALTGALSGLHTSPAEARTPSTSDNLFTLGVASGDPLPHAVVIWTRLAPQPFEPYGGLDPVNVPVQWQVSEDEQFRRIVRSGEAMARPEYAHSVHVDVQGLRPWRHYFYRFRVGSQVSPTGRTRTAPRGVQRPDAIRLAVASCQKWDDGFYLAHRDIAERDHDLVFFVGDYIYESHIKPEGGVRGGARPDVVDREPMTLDEYRFRYTVHKMDPDLQAAHASAAWVVTLDDHEVEDNWASTHSQKLETPEFMVRRANALRAYWEHMPLRTAQLPRGPEMPLYRQVRYGQLANFLVLDTRQHRSPIVADGDWVAPNEESADPARTITGDAQEQWLLARAGRSNPVWTVLVQQVVMAHLDKLAGPGELSPMSTWDGYSASRDRVLGGLTDRDVDNLVVLTGDIHQNFASDLKRDSYDPDSPVIGAEFITTSISSKGDGQDETQWGQTILGECPHLKFHNDQRGYISCLVTPEEWFADYRVAERVSTNTGTVTSRAEFVTEAGDPGVLPA